MAVRIIAVDPGANTGVVVVEWDGKKSSLLDHFTIKTEPKNSPTERFVLILETIKEFINNYSFRGIKLDLMVVEQPLSWLRNGIPLLWMLAAAPVAAAKTCDIPCKTIDAPTKRRTTRGWRLVGLATKDRAKKVCIKCLGKKITNNMTEHEIDAFPMAMWGTQFIKLGD